MNKLLKYFLIAFMALALVVITYELPKHLPDTINEQEFIVKTLSKFRNKKVDKAVIEDMKNRFMLINTAYDLSLSQVDRDILYYSKNNAVEAITNRRKLYYLFKWLYEHPERYNIIVVDIVFNNRSFAPEEQVYDDSLGLVLKKLADKGKVLLAADYYHNIIKDDLYTTYIGEEHYADVRANIQSEKYAVYQLSNEYTTSMPMQMLKRIDSIQFEPSKLGLIEIKHPQGRKELSFNYVIPRLYVTNDYLDSLNLYGGSNDGEKVNYLNLGDLTVALAYKLNNILSVEDSNKNIMIGSVQSDEYDIHNTVYGNVNGPLYLLNIYYNILHDNSIFNRFAACMLFVFYVVCLSWILLFSHRKIEETTLKKFLFKKVIVDNWHYIALVIMVILYYYIFSQVINILYIGAILSILEVSVKIAHDYFEVKLKEK